MPHHEPPPKIQVSYEQAEEFIQVLRDTLSKMSMTQREEVRLIVQSRRAVAVSFDGHNRPFLGYTAGYNPFDARTALPTACYILYVIRTWLLARRKKGPKGGRVFITSECAYTLPEHEPLIVLCQWKWPGKDVVREVISLLKESLYWGDSEID